MKNTDLMLGRIKAMKDKGYGEETIAKFFGYDVHELRTAVSRRNAENRCVLCAMAKQLKEEGKPIHEIAIELGRNESTVRLLLDDNVQNAMNEARMNEDLKKLEPTISVKVPVEQV